jgi:hypothetical protein
MDSQTLDSLAEMICGDGDNYPVYRTGSDLTRFFHRVGLTSYHHDGSTRKWWTLNVLENLNKKDLESVIKRLADPREYRGNLKDISGAIRKVNEILMIEGLQVELDGVIPQLKSITPKFIEGSNENELKPLQPPDFTNLHLEPGLGEILSDRWDQIQKCMHSEAYLAATILMGSMLEGMLFAIIQKYPEDANKSKSSPKDSDTGKVKLFQRWTLSEMINVAHELDWIDLDVKKFSHSLREFRNLIHPYQQLVEETYPDEDTSGISWLVVQAAANDLAKLIK